MTDCANHSWDISLQLAFNFFGYYRMLTLEDFSRDANHQKEAYRILSNIPLKDMLGNQGVFAHRSTLLDSYDSVRELRRRVVRNTNCRSQY